MNSFRHIQSLFLGLSTVLVLISQSIAGPCKPEIEPTTPIAGFRFEANGTVTHATTGLTWKLCAEGVSGNKCDIGTPLATRWLDIFATAAAANSANWGGFSDWRVPNVKELQSLVEASCFNPGINEAAFPNTPADFFWSATSVAVAPTEAWGVSFASGFVMPKNKKKIFGYVRLVRGGLASGDFDSQAKQ